MDFSHGDDLFAHAYLAVNYIPTATREGHIFADCDAWILEKTLNDSPNKPLYEQWIKDGWLHVCPGEVFNPAYAINRIASLAFEQNEQGDIDFMRPRLNFHSFGYDPAQSIDPINQLKAWLQTVMMRRVPDIAPKQLADAIQQMVVPVSQSAMSQTPVIAHIEKLIKMDPPLIEFSPSPLWPWCFGNCAVEIGTNDLRRIVKGNGQYNKIDVVAALEDAIHLYDLSEGRIEQ
jgi:phage terminase large subunit-like protein